MSSSSSSIMTVKEMINIAFGEPDKNIVDHKMIETILYLLARQLRILERKVEIELFPDAQLHDTRLSISELKLHATVPKRRRVVKKVIVGGQKGIASSAKPAVKRATGGITNTDDKTLGGDKVGDKKSLDKIMMSQTGIISSEKLSSDKISTDKTFLDRSSAEKSSWGVSASSNKTTTNTFTTITENISMDRSSSQKTSTEKTSSLNKRMKENSSSNKLVNPTSTTSSAKDYHKLLEEIEEQREIELRVIHQRTDSYELREKTPTPMASLESMVERIPNEVKETQAARLQGDTRYRTPRISVVTQEDFMKLAMAVRDLQTRFGVTAMPNFPENIQLMQELRKGASLTDAMAALQLSSRLEAAEKALERMMALVTELASAMPRINSKIEAEKDLETKVIFDGPESMSPLSQKRKDMISKKQIDDSKSKTGPVETQFKQNTVEVLSEALPSSASPYAVADHENINNYISAGELNSALGQMYDDLVKTVTEITNRNKINAQKALKIANTLGNSCTYGIQHHHLKTAKKKNTYEQFDTYCFACLQNSMYQVACKFGFRKITPESIKYDLNFDLSYDVK